MKCSRSMLSSVAGTSTGKTASYVAVGLDHAGYIDNRVGATFQCLLRLQ